MHIKSVNFNLLALASAVVTAGCAQPGPGEAHAPQCYHPEALNAAIERSQNHMATFIDATEARMGVEDAYGLALAVSLCGEVVWQSAYGYADIEQGTRVTNDTKFRIGSVSKTLTATALGQLAADGRLDLDAEVQTYVPEFPRKDYPITVRQVAGHIAGIRHYKGNEFFSAKAYDSVTEGLDIFKDDPLLFEPGAQYQYSTYGWNLLSAVVEGASGEEFLSYMDAHVFAPAGMNNTVADWAHEDIPNRTAFYHFDSDTGENGAAPFVDNSNKWAGGGFIAPPTDLLQFSHAMFDGTLLDADMLNVLVTSQTTSDGAKTNYGIGWATDMAGRQISRSAQIYPPSLIEEIRATLGDSRLIGHTGGSVGGLTVFMAAPDLPGDVTIATVSNNSGITPSFALPIAYEFIKAAAEHQ